jgi:hypothetical protein
MVWIITFFVGVLFFFIFHFHYLFILIGLEFLMLSLFFGVSVHCVFGIFSRVLVFLVLLVCIGAFGLSLMVFLVRGVGLVLFMFF